MVMKGNTLCLFVLMCFVVFNESLSQIKSYNDYLACGIDLPKKASDCLDHSLNTGFHCCYLTNITGQNDTCALVSHSSRSTVTPPTYQGPPYFECGLSGYFLKISLTTMLMLFIF